MTKTRNPEIVRKENTFNAVQKIVYILRNKSFYQTVYTSYSKEDTDYAYRLLKDSKLPNLSLEFFNELHQSKICYCLSIVKKS